MFDAESESCLILKADVDSVVIGFGNDFHAVNDLWIGAKVGLFCNAPPGITSTGFADIDWFRITP